ncbi:MAG: hypothetical protein WCS70_09660 [Verrucomicrobiota bacterium]
MRTVANISRVKRQLAEIGFKCGLTERTYQNIIKAGFTRSTLPQTFVLAQVLLENQPISVRGAFYRAVSTGSYPNTDAKHYRQVCGIILKLRRAGIVPYSWVTDGTREHYKPSSWSGLDDFGATVREAYRKDFWASQPDYLEVIVEKDAMSGVLRPVSKEYDIGLNVIRGNSSETFVWSLAERLREIEKPIFILYAGDHDPNGLDIERDIRQRLQGFMGRPVSWERLAITSQEFLSRADLTGFPVRQNDSKGWRTRCADYIARYGDKCIEVDALPPVEIRQRLKDAIESHINQTAWQNLQAVEEMERETIQQTFSRWGAK